MDPVFIRFMLLLVVVPSTLILPGWWYARRHHRASAFLPMIGVPALLLWYGLMELGVGRGSLANLVEGFWIALAGVVCAYVQVFVLDRIVKRPNRTTAALAVILCLAGVILRVSMPALPE